MVDTRHSDDAEIFYLKVIVVKEQNAATVRLRENFGSRDVLREAIEKLVNGKFQATEMKPEYVELEMNLPDVDRDDQDRFLTELKQTLGIRDAIIANAELCVDRCWPCLQCRL